MFGESSLAGNVHDTDPVIAGSKPSNGISILIGISFYFDWILPLIRSKPTARAGIRTHYVENPISLVFLNGKKLTKNR